MRLLNILLPAALIALVLFMGLYNLGGDLMNDDEGTYLYASWRVSLGEVPRLTRGLMRTSGPSVADWMRNNVLQEQDAITTTGSPKRPRIQTSESSSSGYGTMNYTMLTFSAIC
jgi:hypothetical protein